MANVAHASLTGAELHEPKGISTAPLGTVYVSNGAGSGSWNSVSTSAFTGMVADFAAPVAPTGWLELDGSIISTSTYSGLFAVMSITSTGTRTSGNAVVTSIPTTTNFKAGYYIFGTGISAGTTILTVDSSTQVTLSGPAGSSGTSAFFVSPWPMNTGTITLPDLTTAGRFRRSRTSSTTIGQLQADQNKAHTHVVTGTTASDGAHVHTITDPGHTHLEAGSPAGGASNHIFMPNNGTSGVTANSSDSTASSTTGISINSNGVHTHALTLSAASDGSAEARPLGIVLLTCIKT